MIKFLYSVSNKRMSVDESKEGQVGQVVKIRRKGGQIVQGCDVYIAGKMTRRGWNLPASKWMNEFTGTKGKPKFIRQIEATLAYWKWILKPEQKELREQLPELSGKVLGCWCKIEGDEPCHGDVLLYMSGGAMSNTLDSILRDAGIDYKNVDIDQRPKEKILSLEFNGARVSLSRVRAALVGLILGDALGVPHEFPKWQNPPYSGKLEHAHVYRGGKRFKHAPKTLSVGQYSDDTEMTLVLSRSIIKEKGYDHKKVVEGYIRWANSGTPMMGKNTRSLFKVDAETRSDPGGFQHYVKAYKNKFNLEPSYPFMGKSEEGEKTQSNGSLMRCFPLACLWREDPVDHDIWLSNPSSVNRTVGVLYIKMLRLALRGVSALEIWNEIVKHARITDEILKVFEDVINGKGRNLTTNKGHVINSFYVVIYVLYAMARGERSYKKIMEWVIAGNPGSDTDTNACIAGAFVGACIGWDAFISEEGTAENVELMINSTMPGNISDIQRSKEYQIADIEDISRDLVRISAI